MSPAHETQSMREIRLLRGRFPRKGGGLTGMTELNNHVGWTTEIIYVNKAEHVYITFHTDLGGKHNHLCSFK